MSYQFNGSTQYLSVASAVVSSMPLTIAGWFNVANTTASHTICSIGVSGGTDRYMLQADGASLGDPVVAWIGAGGAGRQSNAGAFTANTWTHGAAVFTSSTRRLAYKDGTAGTANTNSVSPSGVNSTLIGARYATTLGSYCNGYVAEVGVWDVALTADEIVALAKGYTPDQIRPQSLVMYLPLVRELVEPRKGVTFTNNNTATVAAHCRIF